MDTDDLEELSQGGGKPPLFEGEPEHCSLCGEAGHTHDDHWLFDHEPVKALVARIRELESDQKALLEHGMSMRFSERRRFIREAAMRLFVQSNGMKNVSSWEEARVLWDAKPKDC